MTVRNWRQILLVVAAGAPLAGCLPAANIGSPPSSPAQTNSTPNISGTPPAQVTVGAQYVFQPSASDPDGDALTFTATGLPSWATISAQTGLILGTPSATDVGTALNIVVRVSDGQASATLPGFSIAVTATVPVGTGTATLSWAMPTAHTDGSPLTSEQLIGYRVYRGASPGALTPYHDVDGAGTTSYEARQLAPGNHCFAVSAVSVNNTESALSAVGCKSI